MTPRVPQASAKPAQHQPLADVTILLVDDDELLRCALVRLLQRRGARVGSFSHAEPVLAAARALQPSLVVIDLELPGMTGFEAATALASDPDTAQLPVLALSGHDDERTRAAALAAGAHAFLAKPCSIDELERVVARLARHEPRRNRTRAAAGRWPVADQARAPVATDRGLGALLDVLARSRQA